MIKRFIQAMFHAFMAGLIVLFAYGGPFAAAVAVLTVSDMLETEAPSQRTVEYMASMSMIPWPDPTAEVIEVTEELLDPPSRHRKEEAKPSEDTEEVAGADAPEVESSESGKELKNSPKKQEPSEAQPDVQRSGGKVKGQTQDGTGRKAQACLPDNPKITKKGRTRYRVERALVDYYVNHLKDAEKLAAVYWNKGPGGERNGFRIRRVRCGNDLYQLGFRGGDVVTGVNGDEITSVGQAIKAYLRLRTKKKLSVSILRQRKPIEMTYILY